MGQAQVPQRWVLKGHRRSDGAGACVRVVVKWDRHMFISDGSEMDTGEVMVKVMTPE